MTRQDSKATGDGAAVHGLQQLPTWLLSQAHGRAHRILADALAAAGARGYDYRLLAALEQLGPASQSDLGRAAGLDRSDVALTLAELERQGAVRRTSDPTDRRRNRVALTASGRRLLTRLHDVVDRVQDEVLAPLSRAERAQLLVSLERLQP